MIQLHHLSASRSQRIVWLLEELGLPYELIKYARDPATHGGPPALGRALALGKSPTIVDGDLELPESGAIVEYLIDTYGADKLAPKRGTKDYARYLFWLHFAEGSMMGPIVTNYYADALGEHGKQLKANSLANHAKHMAYVDKELGDGPYLLGSQFTGADVLVSYVVEGSERRGLLGAHPRLAAYLKRLRERPAHKRAAEKGGA